MEQVTASEFARRIGVSEAAVRRAVKDGRITVNNDDHGRPRIDPDTAGREWAENTRYRIEASGARGLQKTVDSVPKRNIKDVRAVRETYEAKLVELKYKTATGELVRADEVLARWSSIITMTRTKLLAVPSRAKIRMPELNAAQVLVIEDLIR